MVFNQYSNNIIISGLYVVLPLIGLIYVIHGFYQMLDSQNLAVDLALRWWNMNELLVQGNNIYATMTSAVYPPSMHVLLWLIIGWLPYGWVAWMWAAVNMAAIVLLMVITYKWMYRSGVDYSITWIVTLSVPAFHSISHALGIGQLTVFYISIFLLVTYQYFREYIPYWEKLIWTVPIALCLGKYSIFLPLIIPLLFQKHLRFIVLGAIIMNIILSLGVAVYLDIGVVKLMEGLLNNSGRVQELGSIDLHVFLSVMGLESEWIVITSMILLLMFLGFNYLIKDIDLTSRLALAAVFARLWVYHGHYDNLMLIFLLLAIGQMIGQKFFTYNNGYSGSYNFQFIIIVAVIFSIIIPARFLSFTPYYLGVFLMLQLMIWLFSGLYIAKRSFQEAFK